MSDQRGIHMLVMNPPDTLENLYFIKKARINGAANPAGYSDLLFVLAQSFKRWNELKGVSSSRVIPMVSDDSLIAKVKDLNKRGLVAFKKKQEQVAVYVFKQALVYAMQQYGEKHAVTASIIYNLGSSYYNIGNYKKAQKYLRLSLEIREKLGEDTKKIKEKLSVCNRQLRDERRSKAKQKTCAYIPQGKIGRYIFNRKSAGIDGLLTDEFFNCNIVVLIGRTRASLLHIDFTFDIDRLQKEMAWVGEGKKVIVIKQNVDAKEILDSILKRFGRIFKVEEFSSDVGVGVAIIGSNVKTIDKREYPRLIHHPLAQRLDAINKFKIANMLPPDGEYVCVFNGSSWINPNDSALSYTAGDDTALSDVAHYQLKEKEGRAFFGDVAQPGAEAGLGFFSRDVFAEMRGSALRSLEKVDTDYRINFIENVYRILNKHSSSFKLDSAEKQIWQRILLAVSNDRRDAFEAQDLREKHFSFLIF